MYIGHNSECPKWISQKFWLNDWGNIESRLSNGWQMRLIVCVIQNMYYIKTNNESQVQMLKGSVRND
jgi:hypothetical protein